MNQSIRVMDEVVIAPPYGAENCSSKNAQVLNRVRKVVGLKRYDNDMI